MNEDNVTYNRLWKKWLEILPDDKNLHVVQVAEILENNFFTLGFDIQQQLVEAMVFIITNQGPWYSTAIAFMERNATLEQRRKMHSIYLSKYKSLETFQDEWYLNDLIDILSREPTDEFVSTIKEYLLRYKPHSIWWPRPSTELFKTHPDIFVAGWTRYIKENPDERWGSSIIAQGFLHHTEWILSLKNYMLTNSPSTWDKLKDILLEGVDKFKWPPKEEREKAKRFILS